MAVAKKAPAALMMLWREGFFKTDRTLNEITAELSNKGYHFGDATRKAAERANFLTISGKRGDRTFTQRHPYEGEKGEKYEKS